MSPRFAYWTILIDDKPTAFRAGDQSDLLPTLYQLRRKNSNVILKWFARGRLWDSREQEQAEREWGNRSKPRQPRARDWRPGGEHRDPRARFDKRARFKLRKPTDRPRRGKPRQG